MDFYQKYELIDPLPGEGTKSFRARQISTGREVCVHLLVGGRTPENERLLARLRGIPAQAFSKLVEVGDNEGTPFVATAAPPFQNLEDWLREQEGGVPAPAQAEKLSKAGTWRVPAMQPGGAPPPPSPVPSVSQVQPAKQPGEFTQLFSGTAANPPLGPTTGTIPVVSPVASRPGEFTQMFQGGGTPVQPGTARVEPVREPQAAAKPPGEFTQLFQGVGTSVPPAPAPVETPTPPKPAANAPGEFTQLFQGPPATQPQATARVEAPPPSKAPGAPGEFTQLFRAEAPPPVSQPTGRFEPSVSPEPAPEAKSPGEFTSLFQTGPNTPPPPVSAAPPPVSDPIPAAKPVVPPVPAQPSEYSQIFRSEAPPSPATGQFAQAPSPAGNQPPGEFTSMFQPTAESKAATPPPRPQQPRPSEPDSGAAAGEFTKLFNSPLPENPLGPGVGKDDWPPPAPKPEEPGAFTRMFQPSGPLTSKKEEPPVQGGEFTRFFKVQGPQGPQFPASQLPASAQGPLPPQAPPPLPPAPQRSAPAGEFTRMFGKSQLAGEPQFPATSQPSVPSPAPIPQPPPPPSTIPSYGESATGAFARPMVQGPMEPASPPVPAGPSEYTMIVSRSSLPGMGGAGAPSAAPPPATGGGGGGAAAVQVNVQGPSMPGVYVPQPQMPYIPQPQIPGVYVQQPQLPQVRAPQISLPGSSTPQVTLTARGPSSMNWMIYAIIGLVAFLLGLVVMLLLKK